jgi:hypothetical protein
MWALEDVLVFRVRSSGFLIDEANFDVVCASSPCVLHAPVCKEET